MILSDIPLSRVIKLENSKLPADTAIFNVNSATDCPNRGTSRCQVDSEECYAFNTEQFRDNVLRYRRRQGEFWDSVTAFNFIEQFKDWARCKRKPVSRLRFNVSGDLRNQRDINKIDSIAYALDHSLGVPAYLYTASSHLNFTDINHVNIMASNTSIWDEYGDKDNVGRFKVMDTPEVPADWELCRGKCKITEKYNEKCLKCVTGGKKIIEKLRS